MPSAVEGLGFRVDIGALRAMMGFGVYYSMIVVRSPQE